MTELRALPACLALTALLTLPGAPAPAGAQQAPAATPTEPADVEDAPDAAADPAGEATVEDADAPVGVPVGVPDGVPVEAADDVFVPSVEVSEDTSVPFPVDI